MEANKERNQINTYPAIISYNRVPTLHQSTARPYGFPSSTSGATYSGVPILQYSSYKHTTYSLCSS